MSFIKTALVAFLGAMYKSKYELRKQIELNQTDLQKIREQCNNEIQKIQVQVDKQIELYEKSAQTDFIKDFMNLALENPEKAMKSMTGINDIANMAKNMQYRNNCKKR